MELAQESRRASLALQSATAAHKSAALLRIHDLLAERKDRILEANRQDLEIARKELEAGRITNALYKRLDLSVGDKYASLLQGVLDVDKLDDPTGQVSLARRLDTGLDLYKVSCPVGVLLIIFESRPEVVVQISCLALKSSNAVILKGGKEATHSNQALFEVIQEALASLAPDVQENIPPASVQLVTSRDEIASLLSLDAYIDLVIPRGSKQLVQYVQGATRIPVLGHADGICSVYIDASADVAKALSVVVDSKCTYPAACNSVETLLLHVDVLPMLPKIASALGRNGVQLRMDPQSLASTGTADVATMPSSPADYDTEFLELVLAVKTVRSLEEAIAHVNEHGSHHTDCIVTESSENADMYMRKVDAAGVYWNASTRFADGFRYGFGAEIGVSTNKTHARGPVGLEGLVIYKYRLYGSGSATADYGEGKKAYKHEPIALDSAPHSFRR
ncbi:hypothetical protein HDU87_005599 [Geranomyces variabilis]|uniref:glutamate-5-semialdehyde dehydrogenase n=1 Tax=Geranomyces variabilis TaxID=109894 RepID=A0AAD5TH52_9FUNG|nr:hypothetical protein HDU87_005599 [Geranomyces variabilis]